MTIFLHKILFLDIIELFHRSQLGLYYYSPQFSEKVRGCRTQTPLRRKTFWAERKLPEPETCNFRVKVLPGSNNGRGSVVSV